MRFQSESTGSSGYTGYVIIYRPLHCDSHDTVDPNAAPNNNEEVAAEVVDNTLGEEHTLGAAEHTLAVVAHNRDLLPHNLSGLRLLLK